jgi:hypothetical protein
LAAAGDDDDEQSDPYGVVLFGTDCGMRSMQTQGMQAVVMVWRLSL